MKNPFGKTRKVGNAYAVIQSGGWTWHVLKLYKSLESSQKDPYARAFCFVRGVEEEYGDVYLRDIPGAYHALAVAQSHGTASTVAP